MSLGKSGPMTGNRRMAAKRTGFAAAGAKNRNSREEATARPTKFGDRKWDTLRVI